MCWGDLRGGSDGTDPRVGDVNDLLKEIFGDETGGPAMDDAIGASSSGTASAYRGAPNSGVLRSAPLYGPTPNSSSLSLIPEQWNGLDQPPIFATAPDQQKGDGTTPGQRQTIPGQRQQTISSFGEIPPPPESVAGYIDDNDGMISIMGPVPGFEHPLDLEDPLGPLHRVLEAIPALQENPFVDLMEYGLRGRGSSISRRSQSYELLEGIGMPRMLSKMRIQQKIINASPMFVLGGSSSNVDQEFKTREIGYVAGFDGYRSLTSMNCSGAIEYFGTTRAGLFHKAKRKKEQENEKKRKLRRGPKDDIEDPTKTVQPTTGLDLETLLHRLVMQNVHGRFYQIAAKAHLEASKKARSETEGKIDQLQAAGTDSNTQVPFHAELESLRESVTKAKNADREYCFAELGHALGLPFVVPASMFDRPKMEEVGKKDEKNDGEEKKEAKKIFSWFLGKLPMPEKLMDLGVDPLGEMCKNNFYVQHHVHYLPFLMQNPDNLISAICRDSALKMANYRDFRGKCPLLMHIIGISAENVEMNAE